MIDSVRTRNARRSAAPQPAVAPIAQAVRKALAVSTMALALASPLAVHAAEAPRPQAVAAAYVLPAFPDPVDETLVRSAQPPSAVHAGFASGIAMATTGATIADAELDLVNDDVIDIIDAPATGDAGAFGLIGLADERASVVNNGTIGVHATSLDGAAIAYGAVADATLSGIAVMINAGDIVADAVAGAGSAYATAALAYADVGSVFNDGSATANATATGGDAIARAARVYAAYAAIENTGALAATATATGGDATATGADSFGYFGTTVVNAGDIDALAMADGGDARASGIYSLATLASSYAYNTGSVHAEAHGAGAVANGIISASLAYGHGVTVNTGDVTAIAVGDIAEYGEVEAIAFGIYNFALAYSSVVENTGDVVASASALADITLEDGLVQAQAVGIAAVNQYGVFDTAIYTSGSIHASAVASLGFATAWGAAAQSSGAYGGATLVENSGDITAYAHVDVGVAAATGIDAVNYFTGAGVVNYGDIVAVADTERGIVNYVVNYADAIGVRVFSPYGPATFDNFGDVTAVAQSYGAINGAVGVQVQGDLVGIHNAAGATITAIGDAQVFGLGAATGIEAFGTHAADIVNDGTIDVRGYAQAFIESPDRGFYGASRAIGIYASANLYGDIGIVNNGDIFATALTTHGETFFQAGAGATGAHAYAKYDAVVVNNGRIVATAVSDLGVTGAYGMVGEGKYSTEIVNNGDVIASATVGSLSTDAYGGRAVAMGLKIFNSDHASIVNNALVSAQATATADSRYASATLAQSWGASIGYNSTVLDGIIENGGRIESSARADFGYATAYGTFVDTVYDSATVNAGDIVASATAVQGDAWAVGAFGFGLQSEYVVPCDEYGCDYGSAYFRTIGGVAALDNTGGIVAMAEAEGGTATAYGAVQLGGHGAGIVNGGDILAIATADEAAAIGVLANSFERLASIDNSGMIGAQATGASAEATGALALGGLAGVGFGAVTATIVNSGDIVARAEGDLATAIGASATDRGLDGVGLGNSGTIVAGAYGADATATAVVLDSFGINTLHNAGTLSALGDGERIAVWSSAGAVADLNNGGTMIGSIITGDLADTFTNGPSGTWVAVGTSDFGTGDDLVANAGSTLLDGATIVFGGDAGDMFDNTGTLAVRGDSVIDFGGTGVFANSGWITLVDGVADDSLAIAGNLSGQGGIGFDVGATGDLLTVAGDVDAAAVQTLDINLLARPESNAFSVDLVRVGGDSLAGNFVLGDVAYAAGFVTLDFGLVADIDASNASDDVFSLGVSVAGLSAAGKVSAALAPGVQTLVDAQVGTWRQRMGVLPEERGDGPNAWVRGFSTSGDVDAGLAGVGNVDTLGFHQSTQGWELGLDFAVTDHLSLGMLAGQSDASQRIDDAGNNRLDAETFGLYATWLAGNGFYVDLSQRWTGVEARLKTAGGTYGAELDAATTNIEAGFTAWTVGGVGITPQLQYTLTTVEEGTTLHLGGSEFADGGGDSSRGRIGVMFDRSFESGTFLLTPYGSLSAVREFDGDYGHVINGGIAGTTSTDGTSALVELGLGARRDGLSITGGVNWSDGGAQDGLFGGQLSLRYSW